MKKKLSLFSVVMLIVTAIDSIRNLPFAALFGPALIFFFLASALVFLIPTSLVAAELSATFPEKGGVYHWVARAFGNRWAMLAIWMQWINTVVWYPSILSFIAAVAAYIIDPNLIMNKYYLISSVLFYFWFVTVINLFGLHFSSRINNIFGLMGTIFPMIVLIVLGFWWAYSGHDTQIHVTWDTWIPTFSDAGNWGILIAIMASFLGMELAGVHVNDIQNPSVNFPKAIGISASIILSTMIFGSLAIAIVLPDQDINLVAGVMQALSRFFYMWNLPWLIPAIAVCIVLGSMGNIINWLISPAKGLLHAAEFGYLAPFFTKKNAHGVPSRILLVQAILVSLFCLVYLLIPSVNEFYWFLTALSTELYMIMYVLMFFAALKLHHRYRDRPKTFKIPGKGFGMWITCLLGCIGCFSTIIISFFPPESIEIGSNVRYITMIVVANILTISPVFLFYRYERMKGIAS